MKTALIIGGTGLVGKELTQLLLSDNRYSTVTLLLRSPIDIVHEKLVQHRFDFDNPDASLIVADELFCCLGTTISLAGSKAAFYKVDHDYIVNTARAGRLNGIKLFALVSSMGADKNATIFYNRTKGETEESVSRLGYNGLFIFRPSLLLGDRTSIRTGELIGKILMSALKFAIPKKYRAIKGSQVAKGMIHAINSGRTGIHIFESASIATM